MEKLRILKETGKLATEEAEFNEEVLKIQKKLTAASAAAMTPATLPSEFSSFINAPSKAVDHVVSYYSLLKSTLNLLTSQSPYLARTSLDTVNPQKAGELLRQLGDFEEDEGISQTILNQWSAREGGVRDDAIRMSQINNSIAELVKERERLGWNYNMGAKINPLTGEQRNTDKEQASLIEQTDRVKDQIKELENEKGSFRNFTNTPLRKLEFQQYILQLAAQERYVHALIACGFYRNVFTGGDMSINDKAYPKNSDQGAGTPSAPSTVTTANPQLPMISTITGLEAFLLNRIRDAKLDRESIENMLITKQLSAAESLLRKMVVTAKYQPELQTFPYGDRQKIQQYSKTIRQISEAVDSKNYPEIENLSERLDQISADVGTQDLKAFSKENREKALFWVKQAEVAMRIGNVEAAEVLLDAARKRAPMDKEVAAAIASTQDKTLTNQKLQEQLDEVLNKDDYAQAFNRMNEFAPLVATSADKSVKKNYEELIEQEKSVRAALEKTESLEQMGAHAEAWINLDSLSDPMKKDKRILEKNLLLL